MAEALYKGVPQEIITQALSCAFLRPIVRALFHNHQCSAAM
jgi:hypothetical protein